LLDIRCPVEADGDNLTITYAQQYEPLVEQVTKSLAKEYLIRIGESGVGGGFAAPHTPPPVFEKMPHE